MSMLSAPPAATSLVAQLAVAPDADTRAVHAPFNGEVLYHLPLATEYDVASAAARARSVQREWAERPIRDRVRVMRRFHDLVIAKRDEALDLLQWEVGKARADALEEVLDVAVVAQYYTRSAPGLLRPRRVRGALPLLVGVEEIRKPVGLVGIIAPWNYPLTLAASDAIPALLAGNGVLLKPDPQTTLVSAWVLEQLLRAGLPDGLMAILPGEGPVAGPMVIDAVDHVMFTGSTATGRVVAERCAKRLIGCTLELGGKNAMIVRADVDPAKAAETAVRACFANAGQLCISMERIYVNSAVYDAFLAHFIPRVLSMRVASGPGWDGDIGCLISPAHLERVRAHVDDAVAHGATVLAGGRARPDVGPLAFEPTVLADVTEQMVLCRDETFGPVAAVYPVIDDEEAVRRANDTTYGLNASILTRDLREGRRLARRLRTGSVNVNEGYAASWGSTAAAMGGVGDSGLGHRHGEGGLLNYTEPQTIATQRLLGFGPQLGLDARRWGNFLATAVGTMGRLRL